ncbi:DUF4158 domain-containing protein [Streptomyces decoyicus]
MSPVSLSGRRRWSDCVIEAKGAGVRQEWSPEELLANWTLVDGDWDLVANKSGATRLGFGLLLKFFELEGRFPDVLEEVPPAAVEYVADLVKVPATDFAKYTLVGRTAEYHRKQIREALGFRPSTVADEKALTGWLAVEVCPVELRAPPAGPAGAGWPSSTTPPASAWCPSSPRRSASRPRPSAGRGRCGTSCPGR